MCQNLDCLYIPFIAVYTHVGGWSFLQNPYAVYNTMFWPWHKFWIYQWNNRGWNHAEPPKLIGYEHTWWLIPLSKWVITPIISGLTLLIPFVTGFITHLRAVGWATKYGFVWKYLQLHWMDKAVLRVVPIAPSARMDGDFVGQQWWSYPFFPEFHDGAVYTMWYPLDS